MGLHFDKFKSGGLREKHAVTSWKLGTILLCDIVRTMDKVRKPNISVCYTPSSEPYSI
jgi:hypothetical protein